MSGHSTQVYQRSRSEAVAVSHKQLNLERDNSDTVLRIYFSFVLMLSTTIMCSVASKIFDGVRSILPSELAQVLQSEKKDLGFSDLTEFMLFDCRSFLAYSNRHITGAVNVNCSGIVKKRLQQGKIALADLVTPDVGRECMKSGKWMRAIVYDDNTSELEKAPASHPVRLVLASIVKQGKEALLLKG